MKNLTMLLTFISIAFVSCNNNHIADPTVESVKFYSLNSENKYVEVANPVKGVTYTIAVKSNADIIVIWPGGERVTTKKKGTAIDSIDINGNTVLTKSNYYSDYGLLHAQGMKTNLNAQIGWAALYKYPAVGDFELTVIATNHGYDSPDYNQKAFPFAVKIQ